MAARIPHLRSEGVEGLILRGVGGSFGIKVVGAATAFGTQILLARFLGVGQFGVYVYVLAWVNLLVLVARMGLDTAVIRFVPEYRAREEWGLLRGLLRAAVRTVAGIGIVLAAVVATAFVFLPSLGDSPMRAAGLVGTMLIPSVALSYLMQGVLRGSLRIVRAELLEAVIRPLALVAGAAAFLMATGRLDAAHAMAFNVAGSALALAVGARWVRSALADRPRVPEVRDPARWWAVAVPFMLLAAMNLILDQVDLYMIGLLLGPDQAGIYAAATRVAWQTVFMLTAADVIVAPMVSQLHTEGRRAEVQRILTLSARGVLAFSLPLAIALVLLGRPVLGLFGAEFVAGYGVLVVLVAGKFVNALAGSAGVVLNMTGHHRVTAWIIGLTALLNVVLNALFIPRWGIQGAAFATATSISTWNVAMVILARRRLGYDTTALGRGREEPA